MWRRYWKNVKTEKNERKNSSARGYRLEDVSKAIPYLRLYIYLNRKNCHRPFNGLLHTLR